MKLTNDEKKRLLDQYKFYTRFVHPRWPKDNCELRKTKQKAKNMYTDFWYNGWSIIEALCLLMTCIQTVITIYWYFDTKNIRVLTEVRMYHSTMFVIVIWTRLNRAFRSDRMLGPFVVMLAQSSLCLFRITFLFFEFFIPFSVFCWVIFGGDQIHKGTPFDIIYIYVLINGSEACWWEIFCSRTAFSTFCTSELLARLMILSLQDNFQLAILLNVTFYDKTCLLSVHAKKIAIHQLERKFQLF